MGKSFPGFGPMGPTLVTPDELDDPDDIEISCAINGEELQKGRTSELVFSVPEVIAYASAIIPLLPGDVIFMGTLSGIGFRRTPPRFIQPGDELVTTARGIGEMRHTFRYGDHATMYEELPAPLA
jgi:2-keto-4-pentenoate hydratase/2-oxohepta-3-ene-1,7-dioic acid hydratase in catechol pathway